MVFSTSKKYLRGGPLPFGYLSGKNYIIYASFTNIGKMALTLSSGYSGTVTSLTSVFFSRCFLPAKTALRKSLFTTDSSGR